MKLFSVVVISLQRWTVVQGRTPFKGPLERGRREGCDTDAGLAALIGPIIHRPRHAPRRSESRHARLKIQEAI